MNFLIDSYTWWQNNFIWQKYSSIDTMVLLLAHMIIEKVRFIMEESHMYTNISE